MTYPLVDADAAPLRADELRALLRLVDLEYLMDRASDKVLPLTSPFVLSSPT